MEIHQVPRILIITLKRFKTSKNKYSMGGMDFGGFGGGEKMMVPVEFPLSGLDLTPYV